MTDIRTALDDLIDAMEYHIEQTRPIERSTVALAAARAALAQSEAQPAPELGDRFMEILRAIHGDMPDAFADSARLAFVHALKEAQPVADFWKMTDKEACSMLAGKQQAQPLTDEELADCGLLSELAAPPAAPAVGQDSRILHELAGAASLCWEPKPTGVFDTSKAIRFVESALKELRESAAPPAAQETAKCYSGARGGGKAYLPPEQQLRDALTAMGSTKAQELSAGDLMQVVCDVDSGSAEPAALSDADLARTAEFLRSWRDEFRKPALADGYTPLSDYQIESMWIQRDCMEAIQRGDIIGQVRSFARAIERAVRGQP